MYLSRMFPSEEFDCKQMDPHSIEGATRTFQIVLGFVHPFFLCCLPYCHIANGEMTSLLLTSCSLLILRHLLTLIQIRRKQEQDIFHFSSRVK